MTTKLYFYIQEIFRYYFLLLHEISHYIMALIISSFIKDITINEFHLQFGEIQVKSDGYSIKHSSGYVQIGGAKHRDLKKDFWIFLCTLAPLLFTPLWLYTFYTIHIYIFIIGILYLPTLLPSRSDCNYIYNYLGYKLLLWH